MTQKLLCRAVVIVFLSAALAAQGLADPARLPVRPDLIGTSSGNAFDKEGRAVVVGIAVAAVAVVVVVAVLIRHRSPQKLTGCVNPTANGMRVTDEKDTRSYALSGNTQDIQPGHRMILQGKRKHPGQALVFEAQTVTADLGACPA